MSSLNPSNAFDKFLLDHAKELGFKLQWKMNDGEVLNETQYEIVLQDVKKSIRDLEKEISQLNDKIASLGEKTFRPDLQFSYERKRIPKLVVELKSWKKELEELLNSEKSICK